MITNGFTYIAVLVFIAALLVWLQRYTKSKFFDYAPPIVLLYLITMILCTLGAWDMEATKPAYSVLKNNLLYAIHTAASTMIANGVDLVTTAAELGHANANTTATIYAHQIAIARATAADVRAGVFAGRK